MIEKQQTADAAWPICPQCGHEDREWRSRLEVGASHLHFCTDCGIAWETIIVGSYYLGEIGHGRVMPMIQNRRLRVDSSGALRTIPPTEEEPKESDKLEEARVIISYIRQRADYLSSLKDEPDITPEDRSAIIECSIELNSIVDRIEEGKHLK